MSVKPNKKPSFALGLILILLLLAAVILGGSHDISRENIQKLIDLRSYYGVTGRHPGYKKYSEEGEGI